MRHYSNTAVQTALLAGVTAADPSLTVVDANGYPATPFAIVVDPGDALQEEVMLVTAAAGAAWTVTRGYDGATAKAHAAGATVIHAAIAADFADLYDGLATKEDALGNPASDGYVLSSTAAGARSWIAPGGGGGSPFIASSDSAVPLIARGHSPTQTGDLEQWQASDSGVLAKVDKGGGVLFKGHSAIGSFATPDAPYNGFTPNTSVLNLADATITDLSAPGGSGYWNVLRANQAFDLAANAQREIYAVDIETRLNGTHDYLHTASLFASSYSTTSGHIAELHGVEALAIVDNGGHADAIYGVHGIGEAHGGADVADVFGGWFSGFVGASANAARVHGVYVEPGLSSGMIGTLYGVHVQPYYDAGTIDTYYGLRLEQPPTGATTAYGVYSDGGGNLFKGHSGIGANAAVNDGALLYPGTAFSNLLNLQEHINRDFVLDYYIEGLTVYINIDPTAHGTYPYIYGADVEIVTEQTNTQDIYNLAGIYGQANHRGSGNISSTIRGLEFYATNSGSGDVYEITGAYLGAQNSGSGDVSYLEGLVISNIHGSGVLDSMYGIYIYRPSNGGTITNNYGIYLENQAIGTNRYAFYSNGGAHRFGDYLDLAEISTPAAPTNTHGRLFARDNAGKTELCVRFATGAVIVIASEP